MQPSKLFIYNLTCGTLVQFSRPQRKYFRPYFEITENGSLCFTKKLRKKLKKNVFFRSISAVGYNWWLFLSGIFCHLNQVKFTFIPPIPFPTKGKAHATLNVV